MIKNNGGEMKIKIKAMVQEKEESGIGVRGSLMSIDHKREQDHGKAKHEQILPIFWWNKLSSDIIAYIN